MIDRQECKKCGRLVIQLANADYCHICWRDIQNEEVMEEVINIRMPDGLVAIWEDSISYLSKKQNRAYFKIPHTQKLRLLDNKKYRIIIKEL